MQQSCYLLTPRWRAFMMQRVCHLLTPHTASPRNSDERSEEAVSGASLLKRDAQVGSLWLRAGGPGYVAPPVATQHSGVTNVFVMYQHLVLSSVYGGACLLSFDAVKAF